MRRRALLAKVHIAKKELRLTDALYREFLWIWFGKRSAGDLSDADLEELLIHFKGLGWMPQPAGLSDSKKNGTEDPSSLSRHSRQEKSSDNGRENASPWASPAQRRKIETLWMTGPGVRKKTLLALRHFLNHYFHIPDLDRIRTDQVTAILGAIRKIAHRPHPGQKEQGRERTLF